MNHYTLHLLDIRSPFGVHGYSNTYSMFGGSIYGNGYWNDMSNEKLYGDGESAYEFEPPTRGDGGYTYHP